MELSTFFKVASILGLAGFFFFSPYPLSKYTRAVLTTEEEICTRILNWEERASKSLNKNENFPHD